MTVGQLRKIIQDLPDHTIIIGNEHDHTYRRVWIEVADVIDEGQGYYSVDYGEDTDFIKGERIKALICE